MFQNSRCIALAVKHAENLERFASRLIDDEVRECLVEKNILVREIGAAMAAAWDIGELVEGLEEFGDDAVCRLQPFALQEIKPDGIHVKNGIVGELKRIQGLPARIG